MYIVKYLNTSMVASICKGKSLQVTVCKSKILWFGSMKELQIKYVMSIC